MCNSVRGRLTCWYIGVLSLVLISFSVGIYTFIARRARADVDRSLAEAIDVLVLSMRHEIVEHGLRDLSEQSLRDVVKTVYRDTFPGVGVAIYNQGRLVASRPGSGGIVPDAPQATSELTYTPSTENGEPWMLATREVSFSHVGEYQFAAKVSLSPVEEELGELRNIFFVAVPLALLAAALGGFVLARKSLAPVVEMSETANRIGSKDLSRRISVANPKDELGKLATTLNGLLGRLEGSFNQQRQFMADSSHEMRTPIYVAHTAAQVLLEHEGRPEEEYREALVTIDEQLKRLQGLVEAMFLLARADSGRYPLQIDDYDLGETVGESVRAAKMLGLRRGVTVTGPQPEELPGRADEGLIRQLILLLLDNAIKYTASGGSVSVDIDAADPNAYSVNVRDTGPGVAPELRETIFDRFVRADKSRSHAATSGGGAGLGLAIGRWIAEIHGGRLELVETGSAGSCFRATIPRVAPHTV